MTTPVLSPIVRARIDAVTDGDQAAQVAIERWYGITAQLEAVAPQLAGELDNVWCDLYDILRQGAWADGYACGRNPDKLVFAVEPMPEPIAVDWLEVAPGVSIGVTASAAIDAWLVAGGAE